MVGVNPLVQRALQSRFTTGMPTDSLQRKQLEAQARSAQEWQSAVGGAGAGVGAGFGPIGDGVVDIERIMATIRNRESGGDYRAKNPHSTASGAYQFIDSTWGGYGGYARAMDAPQAIQDAKARQHIQSILGRYGNDLWSVPAAWYTGSFRGRGNLDYNPGGPGNPLTVRQYVDKWLSDYYGGRR